MLNTKMVVIDTTEMHLWDEASNFICSYDRHAEHEMCLFLQMMTTQKIYRLGTGPQPMLSDLAA